MVSHIENGWCRLYQCRPVPSETSSSSSSLLSFESNNKFDDLITRIGKIVDKILTERKNSNFDNILEEINQVFAELNIIKNDNYEWESFKKIVEKFNRKYRKKIPNVSCKDLGEELVAIYPRNQRTYVHCYRCVEFFIEAIEMEEWTAEEILDFLNYENLVTKIGNDIYEILKKNEKAYELAEEHWSYLKDIKKDGTKWNAFNKFVEKRLQEMRIEVLEWSRTKLVSELIGIYCAKDECTDEYNFIAAKYFIIAVNEDEYFYQILIDFCRFWADIVPLGQFIVEFLENKGKVEDRDMLDSFKNSLEILRSQHGYDKEKWYIFKESIKNGLPGAWKEASKWSLGKLMIKLVEYFPKRDQSNNLFNLLSAQFFINTTERGISGTQEIMNLFKYNELKIRMGENIYKFWVQGDKVNDPDTVMRTHQIIAELKKIFWEGGEWDYFKNFIRKELPEDWREDVGLSVEIVFQNLLEKCSKKDHLDPDKDDSKIFFDTYSALFFILATEEKRSKAAESIIDLIRFQKLKLRIGRNIFEILRTSLDDRDPDTVENTQDIVNELILISINWEVYYLFFKFIVSELPEDMRNDAYLSIDKLADKIIEKCPRNNYGCYYDENYSRDFFYTYSALFFLVAVDEKKSKATEIITNLPEKKFDDVESLESSKTNV